MNTRKVFKITLAAMVAALIVVVGIAVWPPPKEALALHPTLDVTFHIAWVAPAAPYNAAVWIELLDENDQSIGAEWTAYLTCDSQFIDWTHQFTNIPDEAVRYRIGWDPGDPLQYEWLRGPPLFGDIDWQEAEVFDDTEVTAP